MSRSRLIFGLVVLLLSACTVGNVDKNAIEKLVVTDGVDEAIYSVDDLKKISEIEEDFLEETYLGVPLPDLLVAAGFEVDNVKSIKAVAADGYSVLYDSTIFTREDVLVAYAKAEEPLSKDDGTFRMVLPGEEGTLNLRMLVELFVEYK